MPQFSLCIPTYKTQFLKDCIESILKQTFEDFELIIVDDCSPGPVSEIVRSFNDERIIFKKHIVNVGAENLVTNWNECLQVSSGDFFAIIGDDDKLESNYLAEFALLISKYPTLDVFHCRSKIIDENNMQIGTTQSWPEFETVYDNIWHRIKRHRSQFISDFMYRTNELKSKDGFYFLPYAWGSDDITAYQACGDKGIAHTDNTLLNYRRNPESISQQGNPKIKIDAALAEGRWIEQFLRNPPRQQKDQIIYCAILNYLPTYIKKRKISLAAQSLLNTQFLKSMQFFRLRHSYRLNSIDLIRVWYQYIKISFQRQINKRNKQSLT